MSSRGLSWSVVEAEVTDIGQFQDDAGEVISYVKLAYWGGLSTILLSPEDCQKFGAHKGKMVAAGGSLSVEKTAKGARVKLGLDRVEPLKR